MGQIDRVDAFLKDMDIGRRYRVNDQQVILIKNWMQDKPLDGGIHFNFDFTEIYKSDMTNLVKVKNATKK